LSKLDNDPLTTYINASFILVSTLYTSLSDVIIMCLRDWLHYNGIYVTAVSPVLPISHDAVTRVNTRRLVRPKSFSSYDMRKDVYSLLNGS